MRCPMPCRLPLVAICLLAAELAAQGATFMRTFASADDSGDAPPQHELQYIDTAARDGLQCMPTLQAR